MVECPVYGITDRSAFVKAIVDLSKTMPPIRGCVQAATVLRVSSSGETIGRNDRR